MLAKTRAYSAFFILFHLLGSQLLSLNHVPFLSNDDPTVSGNLEDSLVGP